MPPQTAYGKLTSKQVFEKVKKFRERYQGLDPTSLERYLAPLLCQKDKGHGAMEPLLLEDTVVLSCLTCKTARPDIPLEVIWPYFKELGYYLAQEKSNLALLQKVVSWIKKEESDQDPLQKVIAWVRECIANEGPYWVCNWAERDRRYPRQDLEDAIKKLAADDKQEWARILASAAENRPDNEVFEDLKQLSLFSGNTKLIIVVYGHGAYINTNYHTSVCEIGRPFGINTGTIADRLIAEKKFLRSYGEKYLVSLPEQILKEITVTGMLYESEKIVADATEKLLKLARDNHEIFWAGSNSDEGRHANEPRYD